MTDKCSCRREASRKASPWGRGRRALSGPDPACHGRLGGLGVLGELEGQGELEGPGELGGPEGMEGLGGLGQSLLSLKGICK